MISFTSRKSFSKAQQQFVCGSIFFTEYTTRVLIETSQTQLSNRKMTASENGRKLRSYTEHKQIDSRFSDIIRDEFKFETGYEVEDWKPLSLYIPDADNSSGYSAPSSAFKAGQLYCRINPAICNGGTAGGVELVEPFTDQRIVELIVSFGPSTGRLEYSISLAMEIDTQRCGTKRPANLVEQTKWDEYCSGEKEGTQAKPYIIGWALIVTDLPARLYFSHQTSDVTFLKVESAGASVTTKLTVVDEVSKTLASIRANVAKATTILVDKEGRENGWHGLEATIATIKGGIDVIGHDVDEVETNIASMKMELSYPHRLAKYTRVRKALAKVEANAVKIKTAITDFENVGLSLPWVGSGSRAANNLVIIKHAVVKIATSAVTIDRNLAAYKDDFVPKA